MSNLENQAQLEYFYEQFREEGHSPQEAEALARQKLEGIEHCTIMENDH